MISDHSQILYCVTFENRYEHTRMLESVLYYFHTRIAPLSGMHRSRTEKLRFLNFKKVSSKQPNINRLYTSNYLQFHFHTQWEPSLPGPVPQPWLGLWTPRLPSQTEVRAVYIFLSQTLSHWSVSVSPDDLWPLVPSAMPHAEQLPR